MSSHEDEATDVPSVPEVISTCSVRAREPRASLRTTKTASVTTNTPAPTIIDVCISWSFCTTLTMPSLAVVTPASAFGTEMVGTVRFVAGGGGEGLAITSTAGVGGGGEGDGIRDGGIGIGVGDGDCGAGDGGGETGVGGGDDDGGPGHFLAGGAKGGKGGAGESGGHGVCLGGNEG